LSGVKGALTGCRFAGLEPSAKWVEGQSSSAAWGLAGRAWHGTVSDLLLVDFKEIVPQRRKLQVDAQTVVEVGPSVGFVNVFMTFDHDMVLP
jgi:hypothetical protein